MIETPSGSNYNTVSEQLSELLTEGMLSNMVLMVFSLEGNISVD